MNNLAPTRPADAAAIEASLALAAERGGDLAPAVYARLFARQPEMLALFWRDANGGIKGEMLAKVFEAILDFIGPRSYAHNLIETEVITHEGYDVPRAVFATFFGVVAEVVAETCGGDWTPAMAGAWKRLLADLDHFVAQRGRVMA
ncbi:globin [Phenylobacterium sp.]|uniref:globin n=1 Tax=Phenylobacterium sp. TaxID=1871053 RepID=UPI002CDD47CC|nr:globin [Phenylobacterium sp.]HLZ75116.1 globin [Phenylobacterium sp.]